VVAGVMIGRCAGLATCGLLTAGGACMFLAFAPQGRHGLCIFQNFNSLWIEVNKQLKVNKNMIPNIVLQKIGLSVHKKAPFSTFKKNSHKAVP
jgi:hypothetical protein